MPLYEYRCLDCEQRFERLVRSAASTEGVECPSCGSTTVHRLPSTFAARFGGFGGAGLEAPSSAGASCGPSFGGG